MPSWEETAVVTGKLEASLSLKDALSQIAICNLLAFSACLGG